MNCPECQSLLMRRQKYVGFQVAVVYECADCKWAHTMYFDTLEEIPEKNKANAH